MQIALKIKPVLEKYKKAFLVFGILLYFSQHIFTVTILLILKIPLYI